MESDHELRDKIRAFLEGVIVDRKIDHAADSGEILLLLEKWQNGGDRDVVEALKEVQSTSHHRGYHEGLMKMVSDITKLITPNPTDR
ncbi:MAG: hypothetical protein ABJQ29_11405 [Luteolibacter sp.]